mmetsp:Transcript_41134/g.76482  ORF Transcript_41134/g.76482 Transcript_41134/m.76482 type:complete len:285 (-) Transcript_41134:106-960(-)
MDHALSALAECEGIVQVNSVLGAGSFSYVFRCSVTGYDEEVAVKVLKAKDVLPGRGRESDFIQGLRHPNLVNVLGIFEGDLNYIILELCYGGSLQDAIHGSESVWGHVPARDRLRAGCDISHALDFLHQQEIIHRDIKSGNAFLCTPLIVGEVLPPVKVGDMGFARPASDFEAMTQGVGTLRYMAPEVLNSGEYGVQADVFSFGILLHECMSGLIPFGARNEASLCLAIMRGQRPEIEDIPITDEFGAEHREYVGGILQACWTEDPDDRESAGGAAQRIEALLT